MSNKELKQKEKIESLKADKEKSEKIIGSFMLLNQYLEKDKMTLLGELKLYEQNIMAFSFREKILLEFLRKKGFGVGDIHEFINEIKMDSSFDPMKKAMIDYFFNIMVNYKDGK